MNMQLNRVARATSIRNFCRDDRGLSTVEYVVILVLIAVAAIGTWKGFGETITGKVMDQGKAISGMENATSKTK